MTDMAILCGIELVATRNLGWHGKLQPDTRLVEALDLDSLRLLTFVVALEDHFRIKLDEGDEAGIATTADLVAMVRKHCAS